MQVHRRKKIVPKMHESPLDTPMSMQEHICVGLEVDKRPMLKILVRFDEDRCTHDDAGSGVENSICVVSVGSGDKADKSHINRSVEANHDDGSCVGKICVGNGGDE